MKIFDKLYEICCSEKSEHLLELENIVDENRAILRERISKEDRKIVLKIVDDLYMVTNLKSRDDFVKGFTLTYEIMNELNNNKLEAVIKRINICAKLQFCHSP
ncbi:MAG: hypothetical protein R3Y35_13105 [Clostridia bacterium]